MSHWIGFDPIFNRVNIQSGGDYAVKLYLHQGVNIQSELFFFKKIYFSHGCEAGGDEEEEEQEEE